MLMMARYIQGREHGQVCRDGGNQVPEENEAFRSANAAGKLDKIAVAVLHDTGADHAGIPGPFDEDVCQNHVLYVDAEQCNDRKIP